MTLARLNGSESLATTPHRSQLSIDHKPAEASGQNLYETQTLPASFFAYTYASGFVGVGVYDWYVNCTSTSGFQNISAADNFTIVATPDVPEFSTWAIIIALIAIILFVAWSFRKVSKPVASWKYGLGAIVALVHDVLIVVGVFSVLGHFCMGFEADVLVVTALLTILGYSVNDTIGVYDRTR